MDCEYIRPCWKNRTAKKDYPGVNYIHPLKQGRIEELIEYVRSSCPSVNAIVVFGSSVSPDCSVDSDIDIVVFEEDGKMTFIPPDNDEYDVLCPQHISADSQMMEDILKEGVVVYETNAF